jgi:YbbR domain-containing protein
MEDRRKSFPKRAWHFVFSDMRWKVISILCAVTFWSYVILSDTSIVRDRGFIFRASDINLTGLSELEARTLTIMPDAARSIDEIYMRIEVTQGNMDRLNSGNVRVELDFRKVRQKGIQSVPLAGITPYGRVVEIIPAAVDIFIDSLDSRNLQVDVEFTGEADGFIYRQTRVNPSPIIVSGPASLVEKVVSAKAICDVNGADSSRTFAEPFEILDRNGDAVDDLTFSASTVSIYVDVTPYRFISIYDGIEAATAGEPAEGYVITDIDIQPSQLSASGDAELLDAIEYLTINPVDVSGLTATKSVEAAVNSAGLSLSNNTVQVTVFIEELTHTQRFKKIEVACKNQRADSKYSIKNKNVGVVVTGPYHTVTNLRPEDLILMVDVSGLEPGTYELPIEVTVDNSTELTFEAEPAAAIVTVS